MTKSSIPLRIPPPDASFSAVTQQQDHPLIRGPSRKEQAVQQNVQRIQKTVSDVVAGALAVAQGLPEAAASLRPRASAGPAAAKAARGFVPWFLPHPTSLIARGRNLRRVEPRFVRYRVY